MRPLLPLTSGCHLKIVHDGVYRLDCFVYSALQKCFQVLYPFHWFFFLECCEKLCDALLTDLLAASHLDVVILMHDFQFSGYVLFQPRDLLDCSLPERHKKCLNHFRCLLNPSRCFGVSSSHHFLDIRREEIFDWDPLMVFMIIEALDAEQRLLPAAVLGAYELDGIVVGEAVGQVVEDSAWCFVRVAADKHLIIITPTVLGMLQEIHMEHIMRIDVKI